MKHYLLILIIMVFGFCAIAQIPNKTYYTIKGQIKGLVSGKIYLRGNSSFLYYGENRYWDSAIIQNEKFELKRTQSDTLTYVYRFVIQSDNVEGETGVVFIEPKDMEVQIDTVDEYISPVIRFSSDQDEMKYNYERRFAPLVKNVSDFYAEADNLYERYKYKVPDSISINLSERRGRLIFYGDSLLYEYSKENRQSYISLWKLIERFDNFGYKDKYAEIYQLLSTSIKNTSIGRLLWQNLEMAKTVSLNSSFPEIILKDLNNNIVRFANKDYKGKIVLIDLWFNNCVPCLHQFPLFKELYDNPANTGFQIVGISVDSHDDLPALKKVVEQQKLRWPQFLDEDGALTKQFNIHTFPSNFLLDENGIIIKKNISPEELRKFLVLIDSNMYFRDYIKDLEPT